MGGPMAPFLGGGGPMAMAPQQVPIGPNPAPLPAIGPLTTNPLVAGIGPNPAPLPFIQPPTVLVSDPTGLGGAGYVPVPYTGPVVGQVTGTTTYLGGGKYIQNP